MGVKANHYTDFYLCGFPITLSSFHWLLEGASSSLMNTFSPSFWKSA